MPTLFYNQYFLCIFNRESIFSMFLPFADSRDWQTSKTGQLLCNDCRSHLKKTNELPPTKDTTTTTTTTNKPEKDNNNKEPTYLFRPVAESPDASPQRMRTRNKAAKEQTSNRGARPKRGGTETPEPKTPSKQQQTNGGSPVVAQQPTTPGKKKGSKNEKAETPTKSRKRAQEKSEETENEEKEMGLFKKKRERAESPSSVTTDSGSVNDDMENNEAEAEAIIETEKPVKVETPEPVATTSAPSTTVPVITSTKTTEPMPLNVSIRLPDDMNERKNLIKRNLVEYNLEPPLKCVAEVKKESVKIENGTLKPEKDMKEEFKPAELIIPKVVALEKPVIKEEVSECSVDVAKEEVAPINFGVKEQAPQPQHLNHYPLNLKEPPKELNTVYNYNKDPIIKVEPRDEPMELTNNNNYNAPPLNIPTVIPTRTPEESEKRETTIGQPPLPNLMQSGNLVTIGGNQQHYGYMPYPHEKPQNEPQNLKIKQEVGETVPPTTASVTVQPPPAAYVVSSPLPPSDPLQSLKDVKVPGFGLASEPVVDVIKKEPDFTPRPLTSPAQPQQPPVEKSPALKSATPVSIAQTPPPPPQTSNHSAINLISPSSTASMPPQQSHPFSSPMHPPPHSLMHHPFLMHQFHSHPYSGYPFSYPYPYGPVPQPHAIPPPTSTPLKSTIDTVSTTMLSSQHTTSSSLTAKREIREPDENGTERHQTHEMTLTHQQSTSHHSTVHASSEKHNYGGGTNHSITISHSTSSSSSQSVQHKVNQKTVRTSSPHASMNQTSSGGSISTHTHHHTHHHERLSPSGSQLLNMRRHPQTNPHHLMIQPPSMGHLPPPQSMASSSLEQLRAHAAQAAANMQQQQQQQSVKALPPPPPQAAPPPPPPPEEIKIEPDPEVVTEEEPQNSPPGPPRGPSPEPRIEDTECHRSQSAM